VLAFVFTATVVHRPMAGRSQPALAARPVEGVDHTSQGISCNNSQLHITM